MIEIDVEKSTFTKVSTVYNGSTEFVRGRSCGQWAVGVSMATCPEEETTEYRVSRMVCTNMPGTCPSEAAIQDFNSNGGASMLLEDAPTTRQGAANVARRICGQAVICQFTF